MTNREKILIDALKFYASIETYKNMILNVELPAGVVVSDSPLNYHRTVSRQDDLRHSLIALDVGSRAEKALEAAGENEESEWDFKKILKLQWQTIETAPRDGTEILAYYKLGHYEVLSWQERWRDDGKGAWVWGGDKEHTEPDFWKPLDAPEL